MPEDGIEIHFDEKRGCLELACEPDAFRRYLEVARDQLRDVQEIPMERVIELNIVDAATHVTQSRAPKQRAADWIIGSVLFVVVALAIVGAVALITKILR
jgi:hypothetical protein